MVSKRSFEKGLAFIADRMQAPNIGMVMRVARASLMMEDSSYDAMRIIVNTHDENERDRLTEKWQIHKVEELNFVGIVVSQGTLSSFLHRTPLLWKMVARSLIQCRVLYSRVA